LDERCYRRNLPGVSLRNTGAQGCRNCPDDIGNSVMFCFTTGWTVVYRDSRTSAAPAATGISIRTASGKHPSRVRDETPGAHRRAAVSGLLREPRLVTGVSGTCVPKVTDLNRRQWAPEKAETAQSEPPVCATERRLGRQSAICRRSRLRVFGHGVLPLNEVCLYTLGNTEQTWGRGRLPSGGCPGVHRPQRSEGRKSGT